MELYRTSAPPNSYVLNPVGCLLRTTADISPKIQDLEHLKEVLRICWSVISQYFIDIVVGQWQNVLLYSGKSGASPVLTHISVMLLQRRAQQ